MQNNKTTSQVRDTFLDYFVKNGHAKVAASPLIPHNDPSLMFVNCGMVQFKNVFTGLEQRPYTKATSCQKSVRAGGKHNDLDNVGYTARHHTFFEMLGNFSFGDYFKEEAIYHAWNLLTKDFGLDKNKLYATVYHDDEEAVAHWKKISGFSDDRIIRIKTTDNFWSMGDTGPCGPCSEIFYDHGDKVWGGLPGTADQDGDRYIEIWNMVFMQYEQIDKNTRIDLPKKSIDTGMGLERITAVLQGVHNNYEIDLFREIIEASEQLTGRKAEDEAMFSHRVIADHLRSCSFLIADGVMPSNEGRGYVLRRIMRRAMRHAHQLGCKEPLMYRLLPKLVDLMGGAYPELKRAEDFVSDILRQEEERFKVTLDRGLKLLDEEVLLLEKPDAAEGGLQTYIKQIGDEISKGISAIGNTLGMDIKPSGKVLSGDVAFKLYDTYGFPLDLTEDILKSREISVDHAGFETAMEEQRARARKSWVGSGEAAADNIWFDLKSKHGSTEFLGYSLDKAEGVVLHVRESEGNIIVVTNQTPFYGESGGQMGDTGTIEGDNFKAEVIDTKKYMGMHAHICKVQSGEAREGDVVKLIIDTKHRAALRAHHSATHILHAVLREVLGTHVAQKGSLVAHDKLRFDISHPKAISHEDMTLIENKVNDIILRNSEIRTVLMSTEEAINEGAMALFGEKYDDEVRVVSMGDSYSIELCGGTHASRTGDIGLVKIVSESAIAAGVRRIEAVCGMAALELARSNENTISAVAEALKASREEVLGKVTSLVQSKKDLERDLMDLKVKSLGSSADYIIVGANKLVYKLLQDFDVKAMRSAAENVSKATENAIVVYLSDNNGKIGIVIASSAPNVNAANVAKYVAGELGGTGGGGSSTLAQAGGVASPALDGLLDGLKAFLEK